MPVAEPGQTTSEFKVLLAAIMSVVATLIGLLVAQGRISQSTSDLIQHLVEALVGIAAVYIGGRSVRKVGTDQGVVPGVGGKPHAVVPPAANSGGGMPAPTAPTTPVGAPPVAG